MHNASLEQRPLLHHLSNLIALVQQALEELLLLVAVGQNFADGVRDRRELFVVGVAAAVRGADPAPPCRRPDRGC